MRAYRKGIRDLSKLDPLAVWYSMITAEDFLEFMPADARDRVEKRIAKGSARRALEVDYPKLAEVVHGEIRIRDTPPLIYHPDVTREPDFRKQIEGIFDTYRDSLADDRKVLFDRYQFVDGALKVVGIGSVGTRCWIALFMSSANDPLFLQVKQAKASVLEPYAGKCAYDSHGQRVVMGQRLMQAASDIFLGWTHTDGFDFYVRQLRDAKISADVDTFNEELFEAYARACGYNLARSHAKSGNVRALGAYMGKSDSFDEAIATFAVAYANQTERDHAALKDAVINGDIEAYTED